LKLARNTVPAQLRGILATDTYASQAARQWRDIAKQVSIEMDPAKLTILVGKLASAQNINPQRGES
jgi:hypothetical protein